METNVTTHQKVEVPSPPPRNESTPIDIKWPEVWSLAALNAAIVICWIAYNEYQPRLLAGFGLTHLALLLVYAKAIILVVIPPLAGILTDIVIRKNNRVYVVLLAGIGGTAMIFMIVASILFQGPDSFLTPILPILVILWLIGMNIFHSPANSLIEMFASSKKLPVAMGIIVLVTELLYALEPIVVSLVEFFGATLTFVVGGVLISITGYIFHRVSRDEVLIRKSEQMRSETKQDGKSNFWLVLGIGLIFGIGHAFIMNFLPEQFMNRFSTGISGNYYSFLILFLVAVLAIPISRQVAKRSLNDYIKWSIILLVVAVLSIVLIPGRIAFIIGSLLLVISFGILSVTSLPIVIKNLTVRNITFGVGFFYGIAEIADGIADMIQGI
jgi:MFS family permease